MMDRTNDEKEQLASKIREFSSKTRPKNFNMKK